MAAAVCSLTITSTANGQVLYGSIVGTITDTTGAVIANADITLTEAATGFVREYKTNEAGAFIANNLPQGRYEVRVAASGFKTVSRQNVLVTINNVTRVDVTMELGQVTEQITVEAEATVLQTDKSDVRVELGSQAVVQLPLPRYRNYQSLINLVPGSTPARFQNAQVDTPGRALTTNINGTARNNNNTKLDGAQNVNIWLPHHVNYVAPSETVEQVNISTNNFDAEQGLAGGAAITVVTKSGTNEIHGSAFEYHENQRLRARNFFLPPGRDKPVVTTNIFGGTIGGPIKQNKLFYFGSFEAYRDKAARQALQTVPTADQRMGNFSAYNAIIYDPATGDDQGRNRMPFAGNIIPMNRQSAAMRRFQDLIPDPNLPGVFANYFAAGNETMDRYNYDVKINYNRNVKHMMFGKYSAMDALVDCPFSLGAAGGVALCPAGRGDTLVQLATFGNTYILSPTMLLDVTLGWTRLGQSVLGPDYGTNFGLEFLGVPGTNGPDIRESGMPGTTITGYTALGNNNGWNPLFRNDQSYTLTANFNIQKRTHDIRFGYDGVRHHLNHWQPELGAGPRGQLNFGTGVTALNGGAAPGQFNSYASFLLGLPSNVGKSVQFIKMTGFEFQHGLYIRDRWQVTRRLTLTLGLRWEYFPLMTRAGAGGLERYDQNTNMVYVGGYGDVPRNVGVTVSRRMFAPRVGFAYRLTDDTVVRAGYGITNNPMVLARPLRGFFPLTVGSAFTNAANPAFNPVSFVDATRPPVVAEVFRGIPEICCPDLSTGRVPLPPAALMRTPFEGELKRGYIQSWNFILERRLPGDIAVSAGYVGTRTVRSFADLNINAAAPGTGNAGRPAFQQFGRIADTLLWQGWVDANYHSLQTTINRQFRNGLFIKGAYTFSAAINYTDDDGWAGMPLTNYQPALRRNRARAGYDVPHNFQIAGIYELPFGKGKSYLTEGPAAAVLGNWQLNVNVAAFSGRPFTVGAPPQSLNAPGSAQTADQVKSEVRKLGGIGPGNPFFDPTAFAAPTCTACFGTSGRNILRGPRAFTSDLGLFKNIPLTEKWLLQFRAEAFNWTNTPVFSNPAANVGVPASFMMISSTDPNIPERQFRFGLRLQF